MGTLDHSLPSDAELGIENPPAWTARRDLGAGAGFFLPDVNDLGTGQLVLKASC
jgi:hypothetical protein